jgi:hypothetical protein
VTARLNDAIVVVWPTPTAGYVIPAAGAVQPLPGASTPVVFVNADGTPLEGVIFVAGDCAHLRIAEQPTTGSATCMDCGRFFRYGEPRTVRT